jgi:hypothetical protein
MRRCGGRRHQVAVGVVGETMCDGRCQASNLSKTWVALCPTVTTRAVAEKFNPLRLVN